MLVEVCLSIFVFDPKGVVPLAKSITNIFGLAITLETRIGTGLT